MTAQIRDDWYTETQIANVIEAAGGIPDGYTLTIRSRPDGKLSPGAHALPISVDPDKTSEIWVASRRDILVFDLNRAATVYSIDSNNQARPTKAELRAALCQIDKAAKEFLRAIGVEPWPSSVTSPSQAINLELSRYLFRRTSNLFTVAEGLKDVQGAVALALAPKIGQAAAAAARLGRPKDRALDTWFGWLGAIYRVVFDSEASWNPDKRSSVSATTPWIRFVRACGKPLGITLTADQVRERSRKQFDPKRPEHRPSHPGKTAR